MKYKTEMCKNYSLKGSCPYRNKCQFAHGDEELLRFSELNCNKQNFKTKKCRSFWTNGHCPYGSRCQFSHETSLPSKPHKFYQTVEWGLFPNSCCMESRVLRLLQQGNWTLVIYLYTHLFQLTWTYHSSHFNPHLYPHKLQTRTLVTLYLNRYDACNQIKLQMSTAQGPASFNQPQSLVKYSNPVLVSSSGKKQVKVLFLTARITRPILRALPIPTPKTFLTQFCHPENTPPKSNSYGNLYLS